MNISSFVNIDKFYLNLKKQLAFSILKVSESLESKKAQKYLSLKYPTFKRNPKVGLIISPMVFGNYNNLSLTGVFVTRQGNRKELGNYMICSQGSDLMGGARKSIEKIQRLKMDFPTVYKELKMYGKEIENHFDSPQKIEFTVEDKNLWILQCKSIKSSQI